MQWKLGVVGIFFYLKISLHSQKSNRLCIHTSATRQINEAWSVALVAEMPDFPHTKNGMEVKNQCVMDEQNKVVGQIQTSRLVRLDKLLVAVI